MEDNLNEYEEKINKVLNLLTKPILGIEEENEIISFINDYWQKYEIFTNDVVVPEKIWKAVGKGKKVIEEAFKLSTPAAKIVIDQFTKKLENSTLSNQNKGNKLVRLNPNGTILPNDEQNLDVAGFTNVLVILLGTLILGLILAGIIIAK